ncbi:hypothetical protein FFLO_04917 [Filobasidium floriforme]|uniref:Myb-like domain-containing protein n=1 Tax=Filobasidium floriforme TaxID=5210 RepID=A0A8K0NNS4_9TREE|nr:hypothetical protein FFLO_04917 [Filobasidium floriforme]
MDKKIINHILSISDINLRYNWPELVKNEFPDLTTKQLKSRWDNKLKNAMFPPEVMKMNKEAKGGKAGAAKGDAEAEADE